MPWRFWSVFSLYKILSDFSAVQETIGKTLRVTATFPNFQRALWTKKIGSGNKIFEYILGELFFANIGL